MTPYEIIAYLSMWLTGYGLFTLIKDIIGIVQVHIACRKLDRILKQNKEILKREKIK